ncbi:hypothetical protein FHS82_002495 [Pseudochelatococcus lubricantis]|uniref:DUF4214 domain-containing protein n=1 Tax=Pseudochelatococcus lubricantis TaxID=1538102 RepID=A0ABX0V0Y3_9HYPH|nr:DUF4214 domain-containing protein [Pseudochelatococcus lubricantis]NIJ58647.1 hypothetical protein [Pseudochelatococcus lubricantis]
MGVGKETALTQIDRILRVDADDLAGTIAGARFNQSGNLDSALIDLAKVVVHPVVGLYQIAFGRVPDSEGLDYWVHRFLDGHIVPDSPETLKAISAAFTETPEWSDFVRGKNNEGVVIALYQQALGRAPDDAGLAYWVGELESGRSAGDLLVDFSLSLEFITRATPFIEDLLEDAAAGVEPGGKNPLIPGGTAPATEVPALLAADVVADHIASILRLAPSDYLVQSFQNRYYSVGDLDSALLDVAAVTVAPVISLYQIAFNRLPDEAGLDFWVGQLGGGELGAVDVAKLTAISEAFVNSDEWRQEYAGDSTTELVTSLYRQALGRAPDDAGLAYWVDQIDHHGLSPALFLIDFSTTPEFVGRSARLIDGTLQGSVSGVIDDSRSLFTLDLVDLDNGIGSSVDSVVGNDIADWATDRQALKEIRTGQTTGDHSKVVEFVVDRDGPTGADNFYRYQGAKLHDAGAPEGNDGYLDLHHGAEFSFSFHIEEWWGGDGKQQLSGAWVQLQNEDKDLDSSGLFSIVEYVDPQAAAALNVKIGDGDTFSGGFRFWNSDVGWVKYVEYDASGWVSLSFAFTEGAHVWKLNGEEVYRQTAIGDSGNALPNAVDKTDVIETVIFNSQNFGADETYRYDDIKLTGVSANQNFYPFGIDDLAPV